MRVDTPNPVCTWLLFSVKPCHQSILIAARFDPAEAEHLHVGFNGFRLPILTCTILIPKAYFLGDIMSF